MTELAGQRVPRVGLGLARPFLGEPADDQAVECLIDHALETGIRFIDTARAYTPSGADGHGETVLGRVLRRRGELTGLVVSTKGGHFRDGERFYIDARPAALRLDCEASLRRLRLDRLELYSLHHPDPHVPLEESIGALHELRRAGLIRSIGVCNVTVEQLDEATRVTEIDAVQHAYSITDRTNELLVKRCATLNIPFVAYSPLGGTRRTFPLDTISPTATTLANELSVDAASVLIAWLLSRGEGVLALSGASRPGSLDSSLAALEIELTAEDRSNIDAELSWSAA
ncbi:aldo/keto reductase [Microbacterium esteraromaticum]|uniref:aldo/keto reductase n=1 Tax=Microbacterium esteraromaticum TaxID=57043 RepID=UPI001C937420|nr:aldo/keto reductase [Microbacterium esteraromaticum]MBY6061001.1 aldo/keto reductase [Microbacterium esteraromaticum]